MNKTFLVSTVVVLAATNAFTFIIARNLSDGGDGASNGAGSNSDGRTSTVVLRENQDPAMQLDDLDLELSSANGQTLSQEELLKRLNQASLSGDPIERSLAFSQLLSNLGPENIQQAISIVENNPDEWGRRNEMMMLMYAWGRFDAPAAVEHAQGQGREGMMGMAAAIGGWAAEDPQSAADYIANLQAEGDGEDDQRRMGWQQGIMQMGLVRGWAQKDIAGATQYVADLENNPMRGRMVDMLVERQLAMGPQAAMLWAERLPNDETGMKAEAFNQLANELAEESPTEAAKWVAQHQDQAYAEGAVGQIAREWAEEDPVGALDWLGGMPEGNSRSRGVADAVQTWARQDPTAVGEWLNTADPSVANDSAIGSYASSVAREDPQTAMAWAEAIGDSQLRESTVIDVARSWYRQDQEAASAYLETSGLSPEAQEQVTARGGRGGWGGFGGRGGRGR